MPVVIKELAVKVNVEENPPETPRTSHRRPEADNTEALVDACVEKVLEVLKQKNRR